MENHKIYKVKVRVNHQRGFFKYKHALVTTLVTAFDETQARYVALRHTEDKIGIEYTAPGTEIIYHVDTVEEVVAEDSLLKLSVHHY